MDRFSLPFLVTLIVERDGLDDAFAAEVSRRLRRFRDDGLITPIEGTGGKGRGKSAELDLHEAAAAMILEILSPMDLAAEAKAEARRAFNRTDDHAIPRKAGKTRVGNERSSLTAALEGLARGEDWILRFQHLGGRTGRAFTARVMPDEEQSQRLQAAAFARKGETLLGTIRVPLKVILQPLLDAEKQ